MEGCLYILLVVTNAIALIPFLPPIGAVPPSGLSIWLRCMARVDAGLHVIKLVGGVS